MQNNSTLSVWEKLQSASLVEGESVKTEPESPWYVKLLLSISGWFGALFLLIFLGGTLGLMLGKDIDTYPLFLAFFGAGLIFFAYTMFKEKQGDFLEHFFLALSMAGQAMVIGALFFMFENRNYHELLLFVALFQAFLMWVVPNYIHRMMSALFMALSFSYFFYNAGEPFFPTVVLTFTIAWLWMNEFKWIERKKIEAIAYGITTALVWLKYSMLFTPYYFYELFNLHGEVHFHAWMLNMGTLFTFAYVLWKLLAESGNLENKKVLMLSVLALVILFLISVEVNGLLLGTLLLVLGFAHSHHLLTGLGVLSSLIFLSNYYYFTGETLMEKAGLLLVLGVGLLLSRFIMKFILEKEADDA